MTAADPATATDTVTADTVAAWRAGVVDAVNAGARLAGLYATGEGDGCRLVALLAASGRVRALAVPLTPDGRRRPAYPALTPDVEAADWYERAMADLSGVAPVGHPHPAPLLLPRGEDAAAPVPGAARTPSGVAPLEAPWQARMTGRGAFTIPYGPVRSGVFESIEYLVETPGEDIPHVSIRPWFKHRGIAKRFEQIRPAAGVLVAERVEGIASVAHALAFCHALEGLAGVTVPEAGGLWRVILAELERIANHLDVAMRLAEAAGLSVAVARFGWHKEQIMRVTSGLCGSRFGRGVIVPGGVRFRAEAPDPTALAGQVARLTGPLRGDIRALMASPSFLDRVRGTGILDAGRAHRYGALGPVGRASGAENDVRRVAPYDGYRSLPAVLEAGVTTGDALGRLRVRWAEVTDALALIDAAAARLARLPGALVASPVTYPARGFTTGRAEAPQGEVLYALQVAEGRVRRCFARSASFHNLRLFQDVWHGDVKTDFAFIEASFGLSPAGVAM